MGRRGAPVKDSQSVPLPHDGPLAQWIAKDDEWADDDPIIQQSVHLFRRFNKAAVETPSEQLLFTLVHATSIEEQLRAVQHFKGIILQKDDKQHHDHAAFEPLFRILLEFSLSTKTPASLRRALQSNLDAMVQVTQRREETSTCFENAMDQILATLLDFDVAPTYWTDPLTSLQHVVGYERMGERIPSVTSVSLLWKHSQSVVLDASQWNKIILANVDRAAQIATIFKSVHPVPFELEELVNLRDFFFRVITFSALPVDQLRVVVVAYGRAHEWNADNLQLFLDDTLPVLTDIQQATLLHGVLASLDGQVLLQPSENGELFLNVLLAALKRLALQSPDPHIRLAALKCLRALISLCEDCPDMTHDNQLFQFLTDEALDVVLQSWENPDRRLAGSLPSIFQAIVRAKRQQPDAMQLKALVQTILQQPPHRKGRYIALETILPETGAQALLDSAGPGLIDEFLLGIADYGHNTVAIADLWAKLLQNLLQERLQGAGVEKDTEASNRKERRKPKNEPRNLGTLNAIQAETTTRIIVGWMTIWIPGLARAMVSMEATRRKQVASFCLPRIIKVVKDNKAHASVVFKDLLLETAALRTEKTIKLPLSERDMMDDRILWAHFEIVLAAWKENLIGDKATCFDGLREEIASHTTLKTMSRGLVHSSEMVRSSAFRAIPAVIFCHKPQDDALSRAVLEAEYWEASLGFACKVDEHNSHSGLLHSLADFIDRLSLKEAETAANDQILSHLSHFLIDILIDDMILKKTGYPGSPGSKANFSLELLECLMVFSARDSLCAKTSKLLPRSCALFTRTRLSAEEATLRLVRDRLLSKPVVLTVISALRSTWDDTRLRASASLAALDQMARHYPDNYSSCHINGMNELESYALYLASSPRQHECDTGARLLGFLSLLCATENAKKQYFERLVGLIKARIDLMARALKAMLSGQADDKTRALPLAHGLVRGMLFIIVESNLSFYSTQDSIVSDIILVLRSALRLSLSVVADVDEDSVGAGQQPRYMVNPGALGANGITGTLKRVSSNEEAQRTASQRLVVGSWLLTKDSCEALSFILSMKSVAVDAESMDDAGELLIRTQIAVKHTGAAFAAHKALQRLSETCFDSDDMSLAALPQKWIKTLLCRVSSNGNLRNSTLRRSTGYALGFLALMRSELSSRRSVPQFSKDALNMLLMMSLPSSPEKRLLGGLPSYQFSSPQEDDLFAATDHARIRVHSLNVLRMILLDAPLASLAGPIIGDAFVSSIMGYLDQDWRIRNSATLVFSATMLRAVDSDKNATSVDSTSSRAANISDLFKMYPSLPDFVRSVLISSLSGSLAQNMWNALPPGLPLMTFLARVQPIRNSGADAAAQTLSLVAPLLQATGHKHITLRNGAARAIANLACDGHDSSASALSLLDWCCTRLTDHDAHLNQKHGALCLVRELLKAHHDLLSSGATEQLPAIIVEMITCPINGRPSPPLLTAAAFEILHLLADKKTIVECQVTTIALLENEFSAQTGAAELGSIVGAGSCKALLPSIWGTGSTQAVAKQLCELLSSKSFDVRVSAIKTFKKCIYHGIDDLIARGGDGNQRLEAITSIVSKTLLGELGPASHPPNVRRLSRCLLECLSARCRQSYSHPMKPMEMDVIWRIASLMAAYKSSTEVDQYGSDFTAIDGNAVELMSFVVRQGSRSDGDLRLFAALVVRLSDPYLHWRLRHSSATAILMSNLLRPNIQAGPGSVEYVRQELVICALRLCQDSDTDVRYAAAKSLMGRYSPESHVVSMSEHVLHASFAASTASVQAGDVIRLTLAFTDTLQNKMEAFMSEFFGLDESPDGLLNMGTNRKIFEEEVPNDHMEMALPIQLMVHNLVTNGFDLPEKDHLAANMLLRRCESALSLLAHRCADNEVFEVTSDRKVMPSLHSLLLVSTVLVVCFKKRSEEVPILAEKVSVQFLHPLIRQVVDVLRTGASRPDIAHCCFLRVTQATPLC